MYVSDAREPTNPEPRTSAMNATLINPRQLRTVYGLLQIRKSALADLAAMPDHKIGTDWHQDRVRDVTSVNISIERFATLNNVDPSELIERSEALALAESN
jgi:hypothetical protein